MKTIDNEIEQNQARYSLDRQTATRKNIPEFLCLS